MAFVTLNTGDEISLGAGTHTIDGTGKVTFTSTSAQATYAGAGGAADTVAVVGASTDYNASKDGNNLVLTHKTTGKTITIVSGTTADTVTFSNGSLTLQYVTGTGIKLGTQVVSNTTPAAISDTPTGAGTSTGTGTTTGQTFSLTTGTEVKALTTGNDTVDGSVDNSINNDTIVDSTTTDSDVLNATLTASAAATISNVEQINLLDKFGTATLTATAISGGNIKVSSTYGTTATVTGVDGSKSLSIEAGDNITTVAVNDVQKNPTIKLTSAVTSLVLDGTATAGGADDTVTVNLAGNTALNINKGTTMVETITLNSATAANTVTLNTGLVAADLTKITATGTQNLTIKADDVDVNGVTFVDSTTAGTTTLELIKDGAGTALDLTKVGFDKIKINATVHANDTYQVANNASVVLAKDTTADVELKIATGATTVNVDVAATQTAGIKANEFTTINLSSSATSAVETKVIADATDTIKVSGATDITIKEDSIGIVDATGYTGKLTVNMATGEVITATGGNGNDTFIVSDAAIYTIDGGAGNNTLKIDGATDIKGNSLTVSNIQVLNLDALLTVNNAQITGKTWIVQDQDGATTTKGLTVVMNDLVGQGVDLSGLVAGTSVGSVTITGSTTANNIVGSVFGDSITGGAGADNITAGEGTDTVTIGDGQDTVSLTETTAVADSVVFSTAFAPGNTNAATITGFANGAGADTFDIGFALAHGALTFAAGTGATNTIAASAPVTVANNGTTVVNTGVVFLLSGADDQLAAGTTVANAVANAVTALTSTADFAASNVATGDSMILVMDDGTNSFVFHYVADATAATTAAADLELIGVINNVADAGTFATGDFI